MENKKQEIPKISPYVFTLLLIGFGLWCFWDGWFKIDHEEAWYATFNKVCAVILIPWGIYDFFKTRKSSKKEKKSEDK